MVTFYLYTYKLGLIIDMRGGQNSKVETLCLIKTIIFERYF